MTGESFDLGGVLKRVQELQHRIVLAQADLAETEVSRTAAGMVTVTMTGNGEVTRVFTEDGAHYAEIAQTATNQDGELSVRAKGTVRLLSRSQ